MGFRQARPSARIAPSATRILSTLACLFGAPAAYAQYQATVRARPSDAPVEDSAADASVITDERTPRSNESVPQLLSELPGVTINRAGGIGSLAMVSLRGSTWEQVGVYVDGVPLNSAQGGGVDLSTLPLGDVERIEVYRGSTPIAFGSSSLGGILSITTRAPRATRLDADAETGSFDTYSAGLSGSWVGKRVRVYLGAHYLSTAGDFLFTQDNGTAFDTSSDHEVRRQNNAVTQADGTARAVLALDGGRELTASAIVFYRDQGLPGYGSIRQTAETELSSLRLIGSLAYDSTRDLGADSRVRAQLYYSYEAQRYRDPLAEVSSAPRATNDRTTTVGANLRLSRPIASWLRGAAVVEARYQLFEPYDADARPAFGDPSTRIFVGTGVEADAWWRRARMHVLPSVRVEIARDVRSGRDQFAKLLNDGAPITNVVPSARLALVEHVTSDVTLRANAGRYARLPSTMELFGDSGFVIGNPALVPESGWNVDAGVHWSWRRSRASVALDVAGFASLVDDLIQFQQDAYGRAKALNIGRARILGAELSLDVHATRWLRVLVNGTFTDARDVSDTSLGAHQPYLTNRPRFHVYARPEGRWHVGNAVVAGAYVDADIIDGNFLDPANLVELPARFVFGAGVYAEAPRAHLMIVASAQNLGDARTFDFAGFPLPSRSFFLTARINLSKESSR